ncbi:MULTISPECIES: HTTM domain-containing protein [unclassified Mucilaginibacter]|uniref:HTTM domain-containing protein n=1 Tax=unclassified Mucilaginibacter TaxID=2617802 RepID=UPI002AC9BC1A|nr:MULTISPECIES: HTTM domain-containing protein [unclassified Mucilaginibacter]MEB0260972.1 HTTM domain-containing protein [Mucilaginibacter sp. 10I4]MEB0279567.1 HTTM domain-containing protein [Mucilaginibacter sp. 10B2]MEB0302032.1 HTTM domain-containing protein [Mucilaginibacter sp. 5C4]WPX22565.1 HTTM domain-containing protein [Mucilaginibacter sp. 5C4]
MKTFLKAQLKNLQRPVSIAPLATFRVLFGLMMLAGTIRFWMNGWIAQQYVTPKFHFTYMGFDWVHPLGNTGMHLVFALIALSTLLIAAGLFYRLAAIVFFVAFTYVELIDVTNYLNHYYFISLVSFLLIWLPANRYFSLDVRIWPNLKRTHIPLWVIGVIRLQIGVVYFFAGLAKLNPDWMLQAQPMKIWLPAKSHLPVIGSFMYKEWVAYLFSWFGAFYDVFIAFFLINCKTRPVAYVFVLGFHIATAIVFPGIGLFPYVMIISSFAFFSSGYHQKLLNRFQKSNLSNGVKIYNYAPILQPILAICIGIYFLIQFIVPVRFLFYPGHLFWYEEGYRFSWRVMLMEKSGNTFFTVKEPSTGKTYEVENREFLTPLQDKMMSTQPDMILRYAHYLADVYAKRGLKKPAVYAQCFVALNGERSRPYVDTAVNLAVQPLSWQHYNWVLPFTDHEK